MKKIFTLLLMSISLLALAGCKDPVVEETPIIEQVKENLVIDDELTEITLPTEIDGVIITWQSSKANLITSDGVIIKPGVDTSTSLTAFLTYETRTLTKIFEVIILGDVSVDYNKVQVALDDLSFDEFNLIEDVTVPPSLEILNFISIVVPSFLIVLLSICHFISPVFESRVMPSFLGEISWLINVSVPNRIGTLINEDFFKYDSPSFSITFVNNNRIAFEPISIAANFIIFIRLKIEETVWDENEKVAETTITNNQNQDDAL